MAIFNTNQVRHLYVANAYNSAISEASATGTIGNFKVIDGELFFNYKGADTVLRSDAIPLSTLKAKAVNASKLATPLKKVEVTLNPEINDGAPVGGQDYVLRLNILGFAGLGEDHQYVKDAAVHATSGMTASAFYKAMVDALNLSFSREIGSTNTSNTTLSFSVDNATTATKIIIEEKEQSWHLGTEKQVRVNFEVMPTTVYYGGEDVFWGVATQVTSTSSYGNGKKIADLEWFCMGERGDQYREVGYPNYIPTTYLVDPSKEYHVIEFHYAFTDSGVNSYRSEKDITIVVPKGESTAALTLANTIIGAINTATGTTTVNTLS